MIKDIELNIHEYFGKIGEIFFDIIPYPIVLLTPDGLVKYFNKSFTTLFGWSLDELVGKPIPYIPPDLQKKEIEIEWVSEEKNAWRLETRRLTKDGHIIDVYIRGSRFFDNASGDESELIIIKDAAFEKKMERSKKAILDLAMAIPEYSINDLLNYITAEVKRLLNTEGVIVVLLDEEKSELVFHEASIDNSDTLRRIKNIRFPANDGLAKKVITTGEPLIVQDTSAFDYALFADIDKRIKYHTKNIAFVPLRSSDKIIGTLCAINKKDGPFDELDIEHMNMIGGGTALAISNARVSEKLKETLDELSILNRAKDRVLNHLSHELKTPLAVLLSSLNTLQKKLDPIPHETWITTMNRSKKNLNRILEIQYQVEDIILERDYDTHKMLSLLLDQCTDEIEALFEEQTGENQILDKVRKNIDNYFGPKEIKLQEINLSSFIRERIEILKKLFLDRDIEIIENLKPVPSIMVPLEVLQKTFDGVLKNAVENSPDGNRIYISVTKKRGMALLTIQDFGVGITRADQECIFEGFFSTQNTFDYSSKRPFEFNAGGKGADLLRMKIFSERYKFKIEMKSDRCKYIPKTSDICPGKISDCDFCEQNEDCFHSGGTTFSIYFPFKEKNNLKKY